ncbi:MAG: AraC family transcriptional regulator [Clostridia bacterium]
MPNQASFPHRRIGSKKEFEINHYREANFQAPRFHMHDFYEIYLFVDGKVKYYIEENSYELIPGDILMIPPGKMHRPVISNPEAIYERIVLGINPGFIKTLESSESPISEVLRELDSEKKNLIHLNEKDFRFLKDTFSSLIHVLETKEFGNDLLKKTYLTISFVILSRSIKSVPSNVTISEGPIPEVIRYINQHLCENITLDDLAQRFFISKYHLSREFKKYTQSTIFDYIISKRIVVAKNYLREGLSGIKACELSGFRDYSSFSKAFIKKTGISLKQFKKEK